MESLDLAYAEGFSSLEIVPTTIEGNTGYPRMNHTVGIELDEATSAEIDRLPSVISRERTHESGDSGSADGGGEAVLPSEGPE